MNLKSKLFLGFTVMIFLTVLLGVTAFVNSSQVVNDFEFLVEHDLNVLQNAQKLQKLVVDAETGQRGFIIVGDESFLEPYYFGISEFEKLIKIEKQLVSDNPSQVERLERIDKLFEQWNIEAAIPEIELARIVHKSDVNLLNLQNIIKEGTGKNILDELRQLINLELKHEEREGDLEQQLLLHQISKDLIDRETGQRGFLITGDESFLEPYYLGHVNLEKHLDELLLLAEGEEDIEEIESTKKMMYLQHKWDTEAAIPEIEARKTIEQNPTIFDVAAMLKMGTGKAILDEIRDEFTIFIQIGNDLKDERFEHVLRLEFNTQISVIGFTITSIASGILVSFLLFHSIIQPITNLKIATEKIIQGNLDVKTAIDTKDEIGELSRTFEYMVENLKKMTDIEEQLALQKNLRKSLDESSIVSILDKSGKITFINDKFCKVSKYSKDELIGKHQDILRSGVHPDGFYTKLWKVISNGGVWHGEICNKAKDGTLFWNMATIIPFSDKNGKIYEYVAIRTDITQEKIHSEQRLKDEKLIALGSFSSRLAHDIRNPLSIIQVSIENLRLLYGSDETKQTHFERVTRSIDRIVHQVNDVLNYVKGEPAEMNSVSFSNILNESVDSLIIPDRIKLILPENTVYLICDQKQFVIAMTNLILNSVQSIKDTGTIDITIQEDNDEIIIQVKDSGTGISKKILEQVFDPLYTTKQHGTGLGLVSVKSVIELHGGIISVTSPPTIFTITLPKISDSLNIE